MYKMGVSSMVYSVYICKMFMDELYYLLESNGICLLDEQTERNNAIHVLLKIKKKKAKKHIHKVLTDKDIIDVYRKKGVQGIKKYINRNVCYLYDTNFIYNILFHHYKSNWREIEILIKHKINDY